MVPTTFSNLQQHRDEYDVLRLVRDRAEPALDANKEFAHYREHQFRIANNAVRIFVDPSSLQQRSWFVTFDLPGNQYVVEVSLNQHNEEWRAALVSWETTPHGLYYIKIVAPWTYKGAYRTLDVWSNSPDYGGDHNEPMGEANLVGYTQEHIPRAVYWLFDRLFPPPALRRRVSGYYVLNDRRFQALPEMVAVVWIGMGGGEK